VILLDKIQKIRGLLLRRRRRFWFMAAQCATYKLRNSANVSKHSPTRLTRPTRPAFCSLR
jgi:hypothetical protein